MEKVSGYGEGINIWERCHGMEKASIYGKGVRVWKRHQYIEKVSGYEKASNHYEPEWHQSNFFSDSIQT